MKFYRQLPKKERIIFFRIITSLILFITLFILDKTIVLSTIFPYPFTWIFPFLLYLVIYFIIGYDVLFKAARNIIHGQIFDENFLMCLATLGAFALAIYRGVIKEDIEGFDEACAVFIFYQIGEFFQRYATNRSRKSISALMDIRPDYANKKTADGFIKVNPEEIQINDIIIVNPGEKVPLDGLVLKGNSTLDVKALTGESLPKDIRVNDQIISGSINLTAKLEIQVTKEFDDSTVYKILELVENAASQKSKTENFISKFAKFYTPIVCAVALLLAIIPSLITNDWSTWLYRALSFLVVSCPCALVISIPLSFFAAIGASSRHGILIKGSSFIEQFNQAKTFVFDKTGTLTKGNFAIKEINSLKKDEIIKYAAIAEYGSSHPLGKAILASYQGEIPTDYEINNIAGEGVIAKKGNDIIYVGNELMMKNHQIDYHRNNQVGSIIYVAHNEEFLGSIVIQDEIKDDAKALINEFNKNNIRSVMLSGDNHLIARAVASEIGVSSYQAELLPQDKVIELEKIIQTKDKKDQVCFVGDGINDAPSLMRADIGVAMGGVGSDAAIEASDIVLMHDDLNNLLLTKKIAKKTMRIVYENIIFSLLIKLAILILSAFGITNMWVAIFGDVGVAIIAILNALRVNSKYKIK